MTWIADVILIVFFGILCWKLTDGFRRDVALVVPLLLVVAFLRFAMLPKLVKALIAG